jgi:hypothetical protein
MRKQNVSELLFEEYLAEYGWPAPEHHPPFPGTTKLVDYRVTHKEQTLWFEVKEFAGDERILENSGGAYDPYVSIRAKIGKASEKFRNYDEECCSLVLFNEQANLARVTTPMFVTGAMLGNLGYRVPLNCSPRDGASLIRSEFMAGGKMIHPHLKTPQNTTISAIIALERFRVGQKEFQILVAQKEFEEQRSLPVEEFMEHLELNHDAYERRVLRTIVYDNPYARKPLPSDIFVGPFDERWGPSGGSVTQGNSEIVQVGSDIGIHEATPGATLDVGGTATIRGATALEGTTTLPPVAPATTTNGYGLQLLDFSASTWSPTANAPVNQTFRLFSYPAGNNTATPSGTLFLQFQEGASPVANVLSIASNGVINFAPDQTFPIKGTGGGTITGITTSSPLTGSGTAGSVALGLNQSALVTDITPSLESTFNGVYAQLNASNTFTGSQGVVGNLSVTSNVPGGHAGMGSFSSPGTTDSNSVTISNGIGTTETFQSGCDGCFVPGTQQGDGGMRVLPANNIFLGDSTKSRLEIDSAGNELQPRTAGGAAKAMFLYSPYNGGGFEHCFNSALSGSAATAPPCGFSIIHNFVGDYVLDLGFRIDDRFLTTQVYWDSGVNLAVCMDIGGTCNNPDSLNSNRVEVTIQPQSGGPDIDDKFYMIVY